jgi:hypothetical protein
MTSLYEINETQKRLQEMLDHAADDAEAQKIIGEAMDLLQGELGEKLEAYQAVCCGIDSDVAAIKAEEQRLAERRRSLEKRSAAMKQRMLEAMQLFGQPKVNTTRWTFGARKTPPKVVIDDEEEALARYGVPQPPKLDKKAMAQALKDWPDPDAPPSFAHLETSFTLAIK